MITVRRAAASPGNPAAGVERGVAASMPRTPRWDAYIVVACALVLSYVWRVHDLFPILATLQTPTLISLAGIGMFIGARGKDRPLTGLKHPIMLLLGLIFALMVVGVPTSVYPGHSFSFLAKDHVKTLLMMVVVATSVRAVADVERLAGAFVLGACLYGYKLLGVAPDGKGRLNPLWYYDANDIATLMVMAVPLCVYFASRRGNRRNQIVAIFALAFLVYMVMRTGSRGGFLGLVSVSAYLLAAYSSVPRKVRIGSVAGAFLLLSVAGDASYWERMRTILNPEQDYNWSGNADAGRMEVWKRGMGYMFSRPLTGVGVRAFATAEGTVSEISERQQYGIGLKWSAAHNSFVEIGAELGIPGLLAFLAALYLALRVGRRAGRDPTRPKRVLAAEVAGLGGALAAAVWAYASAGFFVSHAYYSSIYALFGICAGFARVSSTMPAGMRSYDPSLPLRAQAGRRRAMAPPARENRASLRHR